MREIPFRPRWTPVAESDRVLDTAVECPPAPILRLGVNRTPHVITTLHQLRLARRPGVLRRLVEHHRDRGVRSP